MIDSILASLGQTEDVGQDQHQRFYDKSDNLFLVLLGLPLALAFQQIATAWLPDNTRSDFTYKWFVPVLAVFALFLLFAIAFGVGSYIVIYWPQYKRKSSILSYLFLGIFGAIILSSLIMGTLAEGHALEMNSGRIWSKAVGLDRSFLLMLAVFNMATIGAEVIVLSDIVGHDLTIGTSRGGQRGQATSDLQLSFLQFLIIAVPFVIMIIEFLAVGFTVRKG